MFDCFNRRINYLRISVTDLCNLRCRYCMPEEGIEQIPHPEILSFEEIRDIAAVAVGLGVDKVRLTGGEPLVRRNMVHLVEMLSSIEGINDLAMTTNGILLESFAQPLKDAGLHRLNVSLDTLDPDRYRQTTRGGDLRDVLRGLEAAKAAGFKTIKLNCVITQSADEPDAQAVATYGREQGCEVRYIRCMDIRNGSFWTVEGGDGGHCSTCNRLRLTSKGDLFPCLFSDLHYSVKELGIEPALRAAVGNKPASGHKSETNQFYSIGG
ncbi:GTP 3',8-cyclase 1 [Pontiella desulfatans]|uniref:GTP 3',8-cyclase 1 n=1 Tax=Pontiella desulfatans TaxID=2750659 RepID=A0A6C2U7I7_PONDE|nr:radical SAM protein [Pontiella desulfatans]VGO15481.1 GTP 3',8-cyclase 1 [Pontiella desulfatans]